MIQKFMAASVLALAGMAAQPGLAQDAELIAEGEKVFKRCAACHQVGADAENRVGPQLADVIGRTAGSVEDFKYSTAMVEKGEGGLVWDETTLVEYLEKPREYVEGTKMAFAGLRELEDREAVVAYIVSEQSGGGS